MKNAKAEPKHDWESDRAQLVSRIAELEKKLRAATTTNKAHVEYESVLEDSLAYVESILDTVREPILVLDSSLHVKTASRMFYQTFQVSSEETIGQFVYDLGNGQWSSPALRTLLQDILPKQKSFDGFEIVHDFPGLGRRVMLLNARKLWRRANHTEHVLLAMEDVTERKRAEEDMVLSNDDLKSFAYIAAHDLRSPLNSGLNMLQLVIRRATGKLDEEDKKLMNLATENFRRLGQLMQDILTFSVAGNSSLNVLKIDLKEPFNVAMKNLEHHVGEVRATVINADALPHAYADSTQMVMVFQNLIGNAMKYRRGDPPEVRFAVQRSGSFWHVSVSDNGQGFEAQYAEIIFQPFKRLHGSDTPGSGIGLATCKRIIERAGGKIWAESTPGIGSTFHFTLLT